MKKEKERTPQGYLNKKTNKWECVCQCNFCQPNGLPKRVKRVGETKREAEERAYLERDRLEKLNKRNIQDKSNFRKTLGEYMKEWLMSIRLKNVEDSTSLSYRNTLGYTFFKNNISKMQIRQLNFSVFDCYYRNLVKNYDKTSYNTTKQLITGLCNHLIFIGVMEENYSKMCETKWEKREKIKLDEYGEIKEKDCLTEEDVKKLIDFMYNNNWRHTAIFVLQMETFTRESELFSLQWNDIDYEKRIMYIRRSVAIKSKDKDTTSRSKNEIEKYLKRPKNGEERIVPLSDLAIDALKILEHQINTMCKNNPMNLVFPNYRNGKIVSQSSYQMMFNNLCDKLEIYRPRGFGPHKLRHTGITYASNNGTPEFLVAKMAGHHDIRTTRKYYSHVMEENLHEIKTPSKVLNNNVDLTQEQEIMLLKKLLEKYKDII